MQAWLSSTGLSMTATVLIAIIVICWVLPFSDIRRRWVMQLIAPGTAPAIRLADMIASMYAPESMTLLPRFALTLLAAVLCFTTSATFGKLPRKALPATTCHVGALPDASLSLVFATSVSHDDSCPVLDLRGYAEQSGVGWRRPECEPLDQGEYIWSLRVGRAFGKRICDIVCANLE